MVARAMRLIGDGVVDRDGVGALAAKLGYTSRHLTRMVTAEIGAGPLAVARAQRAQSARLLLETTDLPVSDVAFASGFASLRQFNETVRDVFATTPSGLRERSRRCARESAEPGTVSLRLSYREPGDVRRTLEFLGRRAVPGVESYLPDEPALVRALDLPHGPAIVRLTPGPAAYVRATLRLTDLRDLTVAAARCRRLLDLDADPVAVDGVLGRAALAEHVTLRPGLRVPGAADSDELAVRAVIGQQISVAGARTVAGRLVASYGRALPAPVDGISHTFPRAADLAAASPADLPMPASRARALISLCAALAAGDLVLDGSAERADAEQRLLGLRGIGPWTAGYIRMRALRDPDVWLGTDLEIVKSLARLRAERGGAAIAPAEWSPWRSYAVIQLWSGGPS